MPSFAFEEPKDREKGKAKVKKRTENFIDYITRGFEYKGKSFAPRKDRKRVELESFTYSSQAMIYGDSRQIIIGKGIVKPQPFKKPIVEPTKIEIRQTFKLGNREMLETVLDKLPDLLVFKAIRSYGSIEGMGYFGKKFYWRVFINEKTGELEFEISCDIYMHIKPYNKKY